MAWRELLERPFCPVPEFIRACALEQPGATALIEDGGRRLSWGELDALMDRVAAALERDGAGRGRRVAIHAETSMEFVAVFLGAARAGVVIAPLPLSPAPDALMRMLADADPALLFLDSARSRSLEGVEGPPVRRVAIDGGTHAQAFEAWLAPPGTAPGPVDAGPDDPFNIVYSSGTTSAPKGVVQPHLMRWSQMHLGRQLGEDARMMISTPLYATGGSISLMMALGSGGAAILMRKFDAEAYLKLAQGVRATHATLAPAQYRRMLARPDFGDYDLSAFRTTYSIAESSPAALKAAFLARWPGGLIDTYGMTEGGGTCVLAAHERPDKLHTVGRPAPGHEIRIVGDDDLEVPVGEVGEVVGRSNMMMEGYYKQPDQTAAADWRDAAGVRFIRTGDYGRLDDEGFLTICGRKRDMIVSGGFNVFPSDIEAALLEHGDVEDAAVVAAPSERWGETPWGFAVLKPGAAISPEQLTAFANGRLGKVQRLTGLTVVEELPRSDLGKVLKRELSARLAAT